MGRIDYGKGKLMRKAYTLVLEMDQFDRLLVEWRYVDTNELVDGTLRHWRKVSELVNP